MSRWDLEKVSFVTRMNKSWPFFFLTSFWLRATWLYNLLCWLVGWSVSYWAVTPRGFNTKWKLLLRRSLFFGQWPKGPMSFRTGGISRCASFHPSICPPVSPPWPSRPQNSPPRPQFCPLGLKLASPMPQICPPDLQSAIQASNQPFEPQICSPSLNSALQLSNMPAVA